MEIGCGALWLSFGQIIPIDVLLGGDNPIVKFGANQSLTGVSVLMKVNSALSLVLPAKSTVRQAQSTDASNSPSWRHES